VELHDSLTGVPHMYVLKANCETELVAQRARGVYRGMFMVINVDHAAAMNYRFGWRHVDDLLQKLARTIEAGLGDAAIGRAGGDGFLVFAKSEALATSLASSVRATMEDYALANCMLVRSTHCATCAHGFPMGTVTIGIARVLPKRCSIEDLHDAAVEAVYVGKLEGRNRLSWAPDD
jgi:diguanylate cyclase (GGDEF)-like protein